MRYSPYESEYAAVPAMDDGELLEYFLLRVFETEEVWGLEDEYGDWLTREVNAQVTVPLWPYERFATEARESIFTTGTPGALSLEYFIEHKLPSVMAEGGMLEIMPRTKGPGCIVSPQRLVSILEGMMDAGEYTLDG